MEKIPRLSDIEISEGVGIFFVCDYVTEQLNTYHAPLKLVLHIKMISEKDELP